MYESFYGLERKPFTLDPDPSFLYLSEGHQKTLTMLQYALMRDHGFSLITGEIGSGKTTVVRAMLEDIESEIRVGLVANTHEAFGSLLQLASLAFGLDIDGCGNATLCDRFIQFVGREYAAGNRVVLVVDEAQNLTTRDLEELRILSNINADDQAPVRIILVGQPELRDTMKLPELEQFAQRIGVEHHLGALSRGETRNYVRHRIKVAGGDSKIFEQPAIDLIFWESGGIPRLINQLCDTALVYGFADQATCLDPQLIRQVIRERCESGIFPGRSREWQTAAGQD